MLISFHSRTVSNSTILKNRHTAPLGCLVYFILRNIGKDKLFAHICYIIMSFTTELVNPCLTYLSCYGIRGCESRPLSKSRLIQHLPSATLTWDALVGFPHHWPGLDWLSLVCQDLSVDRKSPILSTCKYPRILYTSQARKAPIAQEYIHSDTYFINTFNLNSGG